LLENKIVGTPPPLRLEYLSKYEKGKEIEIINQELEKRQVGKRTETYHLKD